MRTIRLGGGWIGLLLSTVSLVAAGTDLRLIDAVKVADKTAVSALLKQGVDVNARAGDGATALHWAAYQDDQETADRLIRAGAAVNTTNDLGITPLWIASTNASTPMVARLLKAGANPNVAPATGGTPLMIASRAADLETVTLLLAHGADVNAKERAQEQTALMWAVAQKNTDVVRILLERGADLHLRSKTSRQTVMTCCPEFNGDPEGTTQIAQGGFTPFLFAARYGDIDTARVLLAAGANVNDVAPAGTSALVIAAHGGHGKFAEFLLDKGADPNAAGAGYAALHAAVLRSDLGLVKALLAHGADPDARLVKGTPARRNAGDVALDKVLVGSTPLLLAARFVEVEIMRALAASGADATLTMNDGTTALMASALADGARGRPRAPGGRAQLQRRAVDAATLALDLGVDVNAVNKSGDTALHMAASKKLDAVIQVLADYGAVLDVRNHQGQTPLAIATMGRQLPKGAFVISEIQDLGESKGNAAADLLRKLGATK